MRNYAIGQESDGTMSSKTPTVIIKTIVLV